MELREIETFLVLAEELHFGRTATRLYVSQSRVSQTIRVLESRVGGRLFDRSSRHVRLTTLGSELRDRLRPAFDQIHRAFAEVGELASGITGELRISLLCFAAGGPAFGDLVRTFAEAHPGCKVTVYEAFPGEALNRLRRGELDLVAHWLPVTAQDLTVGPVLTREDRALAVQVGHPLAVRGSATVADLADYAVAESLVPDETQSAICPPRTPDGRPIPRLHPEGRVVEELALVARGEIVRPTVAALPKYYTYPGVTTVPLHGLPPLESALLWVTDRETAAIRAFTQLVG